MSENGEGDGALSLAWKILYDEDFEVFRDPNQPENIPYYKAKRKEKIEQYKRLMSGTGRVLFDKWKDEIKKMNMLLLSDKRNTDCNCPATILIKEIQMRLNLMLDVEKVITENEQR